MVEPSRDVSGYELTDQAKFELQRWSIEVEKELVLRARINADLRGSRVVNQADVVRALKGANPDFFGEYFKIRRKTLLDASAFILGIILSTVISWLFLQDTSPFSQGFVVAGISIVTSMIAVIFAMRTWRSTKKIAHPDPSAVNQDIFRWQVMESWIQIERWIREITSLTEGRHASARPIGALIDDFADRFDLSKKFRADLRTILRARNSIAHGADIDMSPEQTADLLNRAKIITEQIKAKRAQLPDGPAQDLG